MWHDRAELIRIAEKKCNGAQQVLIKCIVQITLHGDGPCVWVALCSYIGTKATILRPYTHMLALTGAASVLKYARTEAKQRVHVPSHSVYPVVAVKTLCVAGPARSLQPLWCCAGEVIKRYHVGDTPMDVLAAHAADAVPVGVTTGIFCAEELSTACPHALILPSLEGEDVLKSFGLS
jgi:hypothetical protein